MAYKPATEKLALEFAVWAVDRWKAGAGAEVTQRWEDEIYPQLLEEYAENTVIHNLTGYFRSKMTEICGVVHWKEEPLYLIRPNAYDVTRNNEERFLKVRDRSRSKNLIRINADTASDILAKAESLITLDPTSYRNVCSIAVGLGLLTGRRIESEILCYAAFPRFDSDRCWVEFVGQSKGGEGKRQNGYWIPLLTYDYQKVVTALKGVQTYAQQSKAWKGNTPSEIIESVGKGFGGEISRLARCHFDPFFKQFRADNPTLEPFKGHSTRKLYAAIAFYDPNNNPEDLSETEFYATILGHTKTMKTQDVLIPNEHTAKSYQAFRIVD